MTNREQQRREAIARLRSITHANQVQSLMPVVRFIDDGWALAADISPDPCDWEDADASVAVEAWLAIVRVYETGMDDCLFYVFPEMEATLVDTYRLFREVEIDIELPVENSTPLAIVPQEVA